MQGGVIGGFCLLAFLSSLGRTEELEAKVLQDVDQTEAVDLRKNGDLEAPSDLKSENSLAVTQSYLRAIDARSGDVGQSDSRSFEDPATNAVAQTNGDGYASTYADNVEGSFQAKAFAAARGAPASPFNPFNEELGPYVPPGSSFSQAEAQAINSDSYGQGQNSYPYPASYPYNPVLPAQGQPANGFYQPQPNPQADSRFYQRDPVYNPYGPGLSPGQAKYQAENGLYQPAGYNRLPNGPYNQGSSFTPSDSESNQSIIEPKSMLPNPALRQPVSDSLSTFSPSHPYSLESQDSEPYQPVPVPNPKFSPYDRFLVPYKVPGSIQIQGNEEEYQPVPIIEPKGDRQDMEHGSIKSHMDSQNEPYQTILIRDSNPSPYDAFLVPYKEPISRQQSEAKPTQPDVVSRLYSNRPYSAVDLPSSQHSNVLTYNSILPESSDERGVYQSVLIPNSGPYNSNMVQYPESSHSQKQINTGAFQSFPIQKNLLRSQPNEEEIETHPTVLTPAPAISRYESSMEENRDQNSEKVKLQKEGNTFAYQTGPNMISGIPLVSPTLYSDRSREYNPVLDNTDLTVDLITKSSWDPYEYNPNPPSGAYTQLYPSGADAAQSYPDFKPAANNSYNQGISPSASDYPSASPLRPGVQGQGPLNVFASGQSSPIAFEDANSRKILPNEYIFPNKMAGGENSIKCAKENEFHHFWSQELDCVVCICLNEYGVLQPVCASCGGCHTPPPKVPEPVPPLPESITVQPATPGPLEPVPIVPDPQLVPQPEPNTEAPALEPNQTIPTPEPYPVHPEPPSPVPVTFPEPVATLPPPPDDAHCNPLPTGIPFTNPLHPCQICICREALVNGKPEVQIECKESPQCIAPSEVTALPPLPDVPMPIPLPMCEKFPENVLFPHPTDGCKLCKCAKNLTDEGAYEQQITCYPHPDCVPKVEQITGSPEVPPLPIPVDPYQEKPFPSPEPITFEPLRGPHRPKPKPVPLPEVVTVEPLPWPPITTIAPVPSLPVTPRPGPLPGPSPHESCRPFPPNQTFQHPWDECQVCICTEATAVGLITVEVNCYTKPSCCIEPPESVKTALPGKQLIFIEFSTLQLGPSKAVKTLDTSSSQATTSTLKPLLPQPSYTPSPTNIYPGSNTLDPLNQAPPYSGFVDPASSYPYQPNYAIMNPQYTEYQSRLPVLPGTSNTIVQFKPTSFGYPANYQYAQGDAIGNNYPPQGHYQPFDPRYQTVPAPSYPGIYQRAYDRPHMYALRDSYVKPPVPALGGPNLHNLAPAYVAPMGYAKSGKVSEGPEDNSR